MTCFNYNNASAVVYATGPQPFPYVYTVYEEFNPVNILPKEMLDLHQLSLVEIMLL